MQAAHMSYEEEVVKLRTECKHLRQENAWLKIQNEKLKQRIHRLEQENKKLRQENYLLKQENILLTQKQQEQDTKLESLQLIVEELRGMVFKKKAKKDTDNNSGNQDAISSNKETKRKSANRNALSYRRAKPKVEEVTVTTEFPLTHCPDCGMLLTQIKTIIRYVEDIADIEKLQKLLKRVEKQLIGSGYCLTCRKRKTAKVITPQVSILGENVKKFVCYVSIIMRLSFEQISCFFKDSAGLTLSDGEISSCLSEQAERLNPEHERLFAKVRGAPGRHYDETSWKVQNGGEGNYCWITRPTIGEEAIFLMGRSRGKGNAEKLRGEIDNQVGISDDYAAYDNLFAQHQLCMSHPQRKLRDLKDSKEVSGIRKDTCIKTYTDFSALYQNLEAALATDYDKKIWLSKREECINKLRTIAVVTKDDPQKLQAIKNSLNQKAENYFTCLTKPGIPADNNKAERGLRHVVLKRKISYGSKSQKGANTMGILCSTMLSCWWNKPDNFFLAYNQMLTP